MLRHNVFKENPQQKMYFISGFLSTIILCPYTFSKPYKKMMNFFFLALAFDCFFKKFQNRFREAPVNKFDTNYVQVKDP